MEEGMDVSDTFDTYEDFEKALEAYCERENVQYTITDSKSTKSENLKVKRPYDEKFQFRFVKYECKHGPKNKKKKVKGLGLRPNQSIMANGEENCKEEIEAHKECLRKLGFKI